MRAHGAAALLLGMRIPPSYGQACARAFDAPCDRIAGDTGESYVSFFMLGVAGVAELQLEDGIHPNAEGNRRLAETVHEPLAGLVREAASQRTRPSGNGG